MSKQTPFAGIEWTIAWRYLRARKSEGGVSSISLISLIGIALGVFAMIATFAVRSGFRAEYIATILGNEGHAEVQVYVPFEQDGIVTYALRDYENTAAQIAGLPGVISASPLVTGQVMVSGNNQVGFTQVQGVDTAEFQANDKLVNNGRSQGNPAHFVEGQDAIAIGQGIAWRLGLQIGDKITFTSAQGAETAFGVGLREYAYEVVYIVDSGNNYIDSARVYLPLADAQSFFDLEGFASTISIRVDDPENIESFHVPIENQLNGVAGIQDWKQKNSAALTGLKTEDNLMFILLSILVLVASFTIAAGLIMLVKNKTNDIAILRTMGFSRGRITRIFFIAGVTLGALGTIAGVILGALFSVYFDSIFLFVNWLIGGGADSTYALSVVPNLRADFSWYDAARASALSMGLSILITYFPARAAANLDPAEALRHG